MPQAIGLIILGAEIGGFTILGISLATVVGTAVIIGGSIGLQLLLNRPQAITSPGSPALPAPEAGHTPLRQAIPPRIVGYGRVRLAGSYVLFEADSGVSYDVLALHHGKIGGFVGYYLHDDVVTIDGSGIVDVMGDGRYGSNSIKIKTRLGEDTETVYSEISTPLSTIWGPDHTGDGLASLALICQPAATPEDFTVIYPRGKPEPSVVIDCTPIFDPRDVSQSRSDFTTWKVSANPVLQIIDFLTNADRGMGFDWDTLIEPVLSNIIAQADLCDQLVANAAGGVEPRYASNGSYPMDADPADVIASILDTCDGWISENGDATLAIHVGVYTGTSVTLESKHIRGVQLQYDIADEEIVNELTIDYTEPQLDYKTVPGQPWRNEADISERGRVRSQRFALPWIYSHPQARRIAKRRDAQNNADLRGTITTTLYGIRALGERWVAITAPDIPDMDDLVIEVRGITIDLLNAQCMIKFISVNPDTIDAWSPLDEEGHSPTIPTKLIAPPPETPLNPGAVSCGAVDTAFFVYFDDPGRSDLQFQVEYRVNGSGGPFTLEAMQSVVGVGPNAFGVPSGKPFVYGVHGFSHGVTYEMKIRAFAPAGAASAFSTSCTGNRP